MEALILIRRGEKGYWPTEGYGARSEELVDLFNARLGVTPAERAAMEFGSLFGFDLPGARPEVHDNVPSVDPGETREAYLDRVRAVALLTFQNKSR